MTILHLEDNRLDAELVRRTLSTEWPLLDITVVASRDECADALERRQYDLILSDFTLAGFNGLDALAMAKATAPQTPFIFISGTIGEDRAIDAVRSGADDYVLKDKMKRLNGVIQRTLREREERRRVEEAERRVREQADMLNQAHDAIIITDLDHRIVYWNAGAEALMGWKPAEAVGKKAEDLFGSDAAAQIAAAGTATTTEGSWRGEIILENREGAPVVLDTRRTLIRDEAGGPKAHLSISTDVTEKRRLEEQLLRAQRMENIGLLAAGIAHDLNNVLAPILMAAPMLKERITDAGDRKLLTMLEHSAQRGAGLVRQILSFANGAAGQRKTMQLRHLIREIAVIVAETFPKNIAFEERVGAETPPVTANPTQIHQVLLNLCVNARDAMPRGGTLRIAAEPCRLDERAAAELDGGRPGFFAMLRVEDSGSGIPPEVLARMWEPFYTTKERGRGTGLGLSTVRGIIEGHRGFIQVRTEIGRGTSFQLFLPAAQPVAEPPAGPAQAGPPRGNGELILVVDDEQHVRDLCAKLLVAGGYRVVTASDGREAMKVFGQRQPEIALLVSDTQMPNLDGPAMARSVRMLRPELPILGMSGLSPGKAEEGVTFSDCADYFLRKPFKPDMLLGAVHELLRQGQRK